MCCSVLAAGLSSPVIKSGMGNIPTFYYQRATDLQLVPCTTIRFLNYQKQKYWYKDIFIKQ